MKGLKKRDADLHVRIESELLVSLKTIAKKSGKSVADVVDGIVRAMVSKPAKLPKTRKIA